MKTFDLLILTTPDGTNVVTIEMNQMIIPEGTRIHLRLKFKGWYYADVAKRAILADGLFTFIENNWTLPYEIVSTASAEGTNEVEEIENNSKNEQALGKRKNKKKSV